MDISGAIYFKDKAAWHDWLVKNHDLVDRVRLYHYKKNSGVPSVSHEEAIEEALCFGWIDSRLRSVDDQKYALMYSQRKPKSVWSRINKNKAEELIRLGRMTPAGFGKIDKAKRNGFWDRAYTNREIEAIPADLKRALRSDRLAWQNFQRFANTYRNMYIGWIINAKSSETREK